MVECGLCEQNLAEGKLELEFQGEVLFVPACQDCAIKIPKTDDFAIRMHEYYEPTYRAEP